MRLTRFAKAFITLVVLGVVGFVLYHYRATLVPAGAIRSAMIPEKVDLAQGPETGASGGGSFKTPGTSPGCTDQPEVRMNVWAWNSQMGIMAATGGKQATEGSIMCEEKVNLRLIREDDSNKMQENLVAFATALHDGDKNPSKGVHFVGIMGDGSAAFLKGLNDVLEKKLGPEYRARIIGSAGYSRGEDKFMGPAEWKANPAAARGGVVAGVLRDGDWNIAQKWLGDNGLRNNPDEKTWDPDALNWVNAPTYVDAASMYVQGYSEERSVVKNGKLTGEKKRVTVQGCVTWTPGDVTAAQKKGGIVSIASTREYTSQMPQVIIGIDKWMQDNRPLVEHFLTGVLRGGDAVKASRSTLEYAAKVSADVYAEQDGAYWLKYYQAQTERDKTGTEVSLGGSYVNNLADNMLLFGMVPGSSNLFAATYTKFGDVVKQQYPELMPSYPSVDQILDTSYLKAVSGRMQVASSAVEAAKPKYEAASAAAETPKNVIGRRSWAITFNSGQATFTPDAQQVLEEMSRELLVAGGASVQIHGHTDNVGNPDKNQQLSEERAFAVKQWLMNRSSVNFPSERLSVFAHGSTNPVAPNSSPDGRAKNRRVEIVLVGAS